MGTGAAVTTRLPAPADLLARVREYFLAERRRTIQSALGVLWLLDGALQLQPFMYSSGFPALVRSTAAGQAGWIHDSIIWGAGVAQNNLTLWDTAFASVQVLIGLGLLYRPTVRLAIACSCAWALVVWWFGEGFGMILMTMASPLTGAPGAVILYPLIGLIVWPGGRPGGVFGVRGARLAWAALWLLMAALWLMAPSSSPDAFTQAFDAAPSGMSWLSTVQYWAADGTRGAGVPLALVLSAGSAAIAIAVYRNWRPRAFLGAAVVLNFAYWVLGQGFGGIFTGQGTDPNAGPLFVLLAFALYWLIPYEPDARTDL
jgi:hypothetical protein